MDIRLATKEEYDRETRIYGYRKVNALYYKGEREAAIVSLAGVAHYPSPCLVKQYGYVLVHETVHDVLRHEIKNVAASILLDNIDGDGRMPLLIP